MGNLLKGKTVLKDRTKQLGLWADTAPPSPELAPFEGDLKADAVVIGGGYTGLSAALHLAEAGTDVILLEAQEIGFGGSGRNVGLVNAGLWLLPDEIIQRLGSEQGERLNRVLGDSPDLVYALIEHHAMECEAVRQGTLHCAHSVQGYRYLQQRQAQWGRRGAPVTLLDRDLAASKIGSDAFYGALLDLRAGTLQPLAYAYGLAHAARQAGARLYIDSPVTAVSRKINRWHLTTPQGTVAADALILATNAYPDHAFEHFNRTLIPFHFFQFATPPLKSEVRRSILPGGQGAWDTHTVLSSYRLDVAGRLIVGSVGRVDRMAYGLHKRWAMRTISKVFPQVDATKLTYGWDGRIAMTPDHIPKFHILGPDYVMVTSYNGRGIGPGTLFGKVMASFLLDGNQKDIPLPVSDVKPINLRRARELFYEAGARTIHCLQRRL
jgi:glycine/D-amino acid oxidase-like deaminating enzyme